MPSRHRSRSHSRALAAVSLALCLLLAAAHLRSLRVDDRWIGMDGKALTYVLSTAGYLQISRGPRPPTARTGYSAWRWDRISIRRLSACVRNGILGFEFSPPRRVSGFWRLCLPYWPFILLTAIPPWRWGRRVYRLRRLRSRTHCLVCGYDLRASGYRCPECGTRTTLLPPAEPPLNSDR